MLDRPKALDALAAEWRNWRRAVGTGKEVFALGALHPNVATAWQRIRGTRPQSAAVTITHRDMLHMQRPPKRRRGRSLDAADLDGLPQAIARPNAVLLDRHDPALIYAFTPAGRNGRVAKAVVRIDYSRNIGRGQGRRVTNALRTSGYIAPANLREERYKVIWGTLD